MSMNCSSASIDADRCQLTTTAAGPNEVQHDANSLLSGISGIRTTTTPVSKGHIPVEHFEDAEVPHNAIHIAEASTPENYKHHNEVYEW